jgi:Tol biopolymer transport system component
LRIRSALGLLAVLTVLVTTTPPADATFPDQNGTIAFRRFLNEERTWGAVFTIRPNGTRERQITFPDEGFVDRNPDVSPDGLRIVFQREGEVSSEIWAVDIDGQHLTQLTHPDPGCLPDKGTCDREPAWSPDGRRIAFSRDTGSIEDENVGLYLMKPDGTGVHQITQLDTPGQGFDHAAQFSPDGRQLVFERDNVRDAKPVNGIALWVLNLRTGAERRITPWRLTAGDTPDWSPDGTRILFHDNVAADPDVSANLYTVRPNGRGLHQLTFESGGTVNYLGSSYSPDGRFITVGRRPETGGTNADILVMWVDGTHIRNITHSVLYDSYPDWGPRPPHCHGNA